jgi:hypothetical protein
MHAMARTITFALYVVLWNSNTICLVSMTMMARCQLHCRYSLEVTSPPLFGAVPRPLPLPPTLPLPGPPAGGLLEAAHRLHPDGHGGGRAAGARLLLRAVQHLPVGCHPAPTTIPSTTGTLLPSLWTSSLFVVSCIFALAPRGMVDHTELCPFSQ